ncbi:hypothetical protein GALMADRAFT_238963 [Galerina marginata CBS 339.88]|uniref:Uncharacterized protein n=1 Tax=Galerina marginata (strain CBS 339.88) TaxID=685588 RepID=A0A067TJ01_GALM3|nr:hypothetical protein GALMADRAFT_238963 [Galerina marginata CBS 339.88]
MSAIPSLPEWVLPPPPQLRKRSQNHAERIPLKVFGIPIFHEHKLEWADRFNVCPGEAKHIRAQFAVRAVVSRLPHNLRRATMIHLRHGDHVYATCVYIGSNLNSEELAKAQDRELLYELWKVLQVDTEPGWYLRAT